MADDEATRDIVRATLDDSRYAVLATESGGQPHASLMAFAAVRGGRELLFATYRGTRKHRNLVANPRVALLIDHRETAWLRAERRLALTAVGRAHEIAGAQAARALEALQARHPRLADFLGQPDCVPMRLAVEWYQVAGGIDDVGWCRADALGSDPGDAAA